MLLPAGGVEHEQGIDAGSSPKRPADAIIVLYCLIPLDRHHPDEMYAAEATAADRLAMPWTLIDHDALVRGDVDRAICRVASHSPPRTGVYRGWMMTVEQNSLFYEALAAGGPDAQGLILNQPDLQTGPDDEERNLNGQLYQRALEFIRGEFEARTWQMFWRSVVDGLPTGSIAAELGVSNAAVRQARSRILRRIREETAELNLPGLDN